MSLPSWLTPVVDVLDMPAVFWELRPTENVSARESAVLLLFSEQANQPALTFIKRAETLRHHPGQIAFPGGLIEPTDQDATAAALREAQEEIGLDPTTVLPIGALPKISIEVTGFVVTPVISYWHQPHLVVPIATDEVAEVFTVELAELTQRTTHVWAVRNDYKGPGFLIEGKLIWGFTGTLLAQLLSSAGLISEFVGIAEIEV
jgi:8-oxo-dGTP pyrophosphatase MutT (NUDIX family)